MSSIEPIEIGFDLSPEDVEAQAKEVQKSLGDIDHASEKALKNLKEYVTELEAKYEELETQLYKEPNKPTLAKHAADEYDKLNSSLNQIVKNYAASGGDVEVLLNNIPKLTEKIAELQAENIKLANAGKKGTPPLKSLAASLFSWNSLLSVGATLLVVYGKEIGDWIAKLIRGKATLSDFKRGLNAINTAFKSTQYTQASRQILKLKSDFKAAEKGTITKEKALNAYNKSVGKVIGTVDSFAKAEKKLINQGDDYVKMMLYKAAAIASLDKANEDIINKQQQKLKKERELAAAEDNLKLVQGLNYYDGIINTSFGTTTTNPKDKAEIALNAAKTAVRETKAEIKKLESSGVNVFNSLMDEAKKIAEKGGFKLFGDEKGNGKPEKIKSEYKKLLATLKELDNEYSQQTFDKDQQELNALKEKFSKVRTLIQEFNKDPKNKVKISLGELNTLEETATETLVYRQGTKALEKEVEKQEALYQEYEEAKTIIGEKEAQKRYKNELKSVGGFENYLQNEIAKLSKDNRTPQEEERYQMLSEKLQAFNSEQKRLYNEQLDELQSYQTKRKVLIENFNTQYQKLIKDSKTDEAAVLKENHIKQLDDLDDTNLEKLKSYKALFEGIKNLTKKETRILLLQARQLLKTQKMSEELKLKILAQIKELELQLNNKELTEIGTIVRGIGDLGSALEKLGNSIGSSGLSDLGGILSGLASNVDNVLTAFDKSATTTEKIQAGISSAVNLINVFTSAAAQRKQVAEDYYYSVIGFQNEYNLKLNEQIRLQSELNENVFTKDYIGRVKDGLKSIEATTVTYNEALKKLQKVGQVKQGTRNKVNWKNVGSSTASGAGVGAAIGSVVPVIGTAVGAIVGGVIGFVGGLFGGKKKVSKYVGVLQEYPELITKSKNGQEKLNRNLAESLVKNELINKETKQILENLIAQDDAIEKARKQIKEVISELSGRLGSDLKNELVNAFVSGENAALKMGATVEKVLENILGRLIFNQIFKQAFDDLEKEMAESQDVGGDGSWVDDFGRFFEKSKGLTNAFNTAMENSQKEAKQHGFNIFKKTTDSNNVNSLKGAYKTVSQESINLLAGQTGGLRLTQLNTNSILKGGFMQQLTQISKQIAVQMKIERNTRKTAENTEELKPIRKGIEKLSKNVKTTANTAKANGF